MALHPISTSSATAPSFASALLGSFLGSWITRFPVICVYPRYIERLPALWVEKMDGDLSLSHALGGLRIANPDDVLEPSSSAADLSALQTSPTPASDTSILQPSISGVSTTQLQHDDTKLQLPDLHASPQPIPVPIQHRPLPGESPARLRASSGHTADSYSSREDQAMQAYGRSPGPGSASYGSSRHAAAPRPVQQYAGASPPSMGRHPTAEEWKDRGAAIVGTRREIDAEGRTIMRPIKKGVRDFSFGEILGEGSYSTVYHATDRHTKKEYAIKVLEKRHIIKEKKIKYVNIEKNTLNRLTEHPGIVRLYYTFQDEASLYYVLDLCNNGELLGFLRKTGTFDVECVRFYGAQMLDTIDYMHSRGVIHRDLKPENVLLDHHLHIKITDFGTAKLISDPRDPTTANPLDGDENEERAASFVGTAEYVSPELLTDKSASRASDIWAFGCIIFQLLAGRPPFKAGSEYMTFQKIVNLDYEFPAGFPPAARDLVERCLVIDPVQRVTIEHIKNHEFFIGQTFGRSLWRMKAPRLRPYVPPPQEPTIIQLNGFPTPAQNVNPTNAPQRPPAAPLNGTPRPSRIITELPPPTQLDLEWSPVLTRNNERILKLGDLMVTSAPLSNTSTGRGPEDGHKKFSRFFGGNTTKKRQRLVMVTSSGRILIVPAGGDEKRAKQEISLVSPDSVWKGHTDVKGQSVWTVDAAGYHYTFEGVKGATAPDSETTTADEWIGALNRAKDMSVSREILLGGASEEFSVLANSPVGSPSNSMAGRSSSRANSAGDRLSRNHLSKSQGGQEEASSRKNRFSKRQSRNGLGSDF